MARSQAIDLLCSEAIELAINEYGALEPESKVHDLALLSGGFSRQMYEAQVSNALGESQPIVICVRTADSILASSLELEYALYGYLRSEGIAIPRVFGKNADRNNALGGEFYVMEKLAGTAPNVWRFSDRRQLEENWNESRSIAIDMADSLAKIHLTDVGSLARVITPRSFKEVVAFWRNSYDSSQPNIDPIVDEAYEWLLQREPEPVPDRLVHGDFRIGNCLIEDGHLSAVLDWELAYLGDPRFDLGYLALSYSAGKLFRSGSWLMGGFAEQQWFWDRYMVATGIEVNAEVIRTFSVLSALMLIANLSSSINSFVNRGSRDLRMLWSRLPIISLRQDLIHMMDWP